MANIIEFGKKAQDLKSIRDSGVRQRKIESLRKIFQCTRCMMKCAKCGTQLEAGGETAPKYAAPYAFCRECYEEYEEYRERSNGSLSAPKFYWHNEQWMKVWHNWLEHQRSMDQYRQSKEFLQLLEEVEVLLKQ
jgi:hypothetical protein